MNAFRKYRFAAVLAACFVFGWLASEKALAAAATTTPNTLACTSKKHLREVMSFIVAKDTDSAMAYIVRGHCVILDGGLTVTITSAGIMTHEFVYRGIKLYTPAENLKVRR